MDVKGRRRKNFKLPYVRVESQRRAANAKMTEVDVTLGDVNASTTKLPNDEDVDYRSNVVEEQYADSAMHH